MVVGGVADSPTRRTRTLIIVSIVIVTPLLSVYAFLQYGALRTDKVHPNRSPVIARHVGQTLLAMFTLISPRNFLSIFELVFESPNESSQTLRIGSLRR
jgi:hypothetical protein